MKGDGRVHHSKTASPMEDPQFCAKLREYVKVSFNNNLNIKSHGDYLPTHSDTKFVNFEINSN